MYKEALNTFIDSLMEKLINNGVPIEEVKRDKDNLLKAINMLVEDEKKITFHGLTGEIQKLINPKNMQ